VKDRLVVHSAEIHGEPVVQGLVLPERIVSEAVLVRREFHEIVAVARRRSHVKQRPNLAVVHRGLVGWGVAGLFDERRLDLPDLILARQPLVVLRFGIEVDRLLDLADALLEVRNGFLELVDPMDGLVRGVR